MTTLKELVEAGEISQTASEGLAKLWVTNASELYHLIKFSSTIEARTNLARILEIKLENLDRYANFIKPYTEDNEKVRQQATGCLITPEQIAELKTRWKALDDEEESEVYRRQQWLHSATLHPSWKESLLTRMENEEFRNWLLYGRAATKYENKSVNDKLSAMQISLKEAYYSKHPEQKIRG